MHGGSGDIKRLGIPERRKETPVVQRVIVEHQRKGIQYMEQWIGPWKL
jgi:hypothetical protein